MLVYILVLVFLANARAGRHRARQNLVIFFSSFCPTRIFSISSQYGFVFDFNRVEDDQYPQHKHSRDDD